MIYAEVLKIFMVPYFFTIEDDGAVFDGYIFALVYYISNH